MRKIKNLINNEKHVYIVLKNEAIAKRFLVDAEAEGITFSDGSKPSDKPLDDIISLLPDGTICYVGWAGRSHSHSDQVVEVIY